MKIMIYILILILIALSCESQEIQEKVVMGFKSGLMNSVSNDLMPDDGALVLVNYDITDIGMLTRRRGFTHHFLDDWTGRKIDHLISFHSSDGEDILFVSRVGGDYFGEDTVDYNLCIITQCDSTLMGNTGACTTVVYSGVTYRHRNIDKPYHLNSVMMNDNMSIVATGSDMFIYNGDKFYNTYLRAPGEARVALLTNGLVSGDSIRYKYCYTHYIASGIVDTSNLSRATRAVSATNNKIVIWDFTPSVEVVADSVLIYRSINGAKYEKLSHIPIDNACLDNTPNTNAADTLDYEWGVFPRADANSPDDHDVPGYRNYYPPPGGILTSLDGNPSGVGILGGATPLQIDSQTVVGYAMYYIAATGNKSPLSPMTEVEQRIIFDPGGLDTIFALTLTVPDPDNPLITGKVILRYQYTYEQVLEVSDTLHRRLYVLDTLPIGTTTFYDTFQFADICVDSRLYCEDPAMDTVGYFGVMPESTCYSNYYSNVIDSFPYFNASDITFYGYRLYAIGDPINRSSLFYSDFGKPEIWPYDKYINISSLYKDWLVRVVTIGESLYLFRHNSIIRMSGLSFYQYKITQLVQGRGLISPSALSIDNNIMYFLSSDGLWAMDINGQTSKEAITLPIKSVIDSINNFNLPWSKIVNGELWLSLPTTNDTANNVTYIYSYNPSKYWKTYDIGIKDGVLHDFRSPSFSYNTTKWIFALDNDTLWRWNYNPDADTLDDTTHIEAIFQSKYFFEGDDREKIYYIDFIGSGVCDSVMITYYQNYGDSVAGFAGVAIDSQLVSFDWHEGEKQRIIVNHIVNNFSFKIRDYGYGQYKLRGFVIGYSPWDKGKVRP